MRRKISLLLVIALAFTCFSLPMAPAEEYTLPMEEGMNRVTFYWTKEGADYATSDMWIWFPNADGHGYLFHECEYGGKVVINVPADVEQVGFIVRTGCSQPGGSSWGSASKDFEADRFAVITGRDTVIYLKSGDGDQYTSRDGGKTLENIRNFSMAAIISGHEIRYFISPAARLTSPSQVTVYRDGRKTPVSGISSMNNKVITGIVTLEEEIDLTCAYEMEIEGYGRKTAVPTAVFDSEEFIANYTYDGDDLGAVVRGDETTFKVWAPTASAVVLNLFENGDGGSAYLSAPMEKKDKGVWEATARCGSGTYYTYSVTTAMGTQEAVDPYARAAGVNGDRGMVIDLALTDPEGFAEDAPVSSIATYQDAVVWEVHVRDFSNAMPGTAYPGKYLAFTETGLTNAAGQAVGVDYLKALGITHVHLQPIYDFATVDETRLSEAQFNWGYDPKNYNVPEGSYSTDPYHGEVRITELKRMVQALHGQGIGVVMDVVYNHTYALDSSLNRIVPYYYYRWTPGGDPSNGSGCGNETASERVMFRKYMVDSVTYWLKEYHLDGFRFDLMALHDVETMQMIERAVHGINPSALIYGEGWTGGTSQLNAAFQTTQANAGKITASPGAAGAIAVFNDAIRDGLKGSVFSQTEKGYISGAANRTNAARVVFGITGGTSNAAGWKARDAMVVNYMTSHDNHTLWDKLLLSNPEDSDETRAEMVRLGAAVVMLSRGMPFFLAGEEMLRTKQGDGNSYRSSDGINNINWEALTEGSLALETSRFYAGLIRMRRDNAFLTDPGVTAECEILSGQVIFVKYVKDGSVLGAAWINPNPEPADVNIDAALDGARVILSGCEFPEDRAVAGDTMATVGPRSAFAVALPSAE